MHDQIFQFNQLYSLCSSHLCLRVMLIGSLLIEQVNEVHLLLWSQINHARVILIDRDAMLQLI